MRFIYSTSEGCADEWEADPEYLKVEKYVSSLKTTNDVAERGIKNMSDYLNALTISNSERCDIMKIVEENRRLVPKSAKKDNFFI